MAKHTYDPGEYAAAVIDTIKAERARKKMTQQQVYEAAGIPRATYGRLESLKRAISIEQLEAIAAALNMKTSDLLFEAERQVEIQDGKGELI